MLSPIRCFAAVLLLCAACVTPTPTDADLAAADIGPRPSDQVCQSYATAYFANSLKDPASAIVKFGGIEKSWYKISPSQPAKFAWKFVTSCNAKNSYGGYTGAQPYHFWFVAERCVGIGSYHDFYDGYRRSDVYLVTELGSGGLTAEQAKLRTSAKAGE